MISFSKLPRAGLANKLFVWAHGFLFSQVNDCPHVCSGWLKLHIGPILRREESLRFYFGYMPFGQVLKNYLLLSASILKKRVKLAPSDCLKKYAANDVFVFSEVPHSADYFGHISGKRAEIIEAFSRQFNRKIFQKAAAHQPPVIGIHIRLGDFKVLNINTPVNYYIGELLKLRTIVGDLPATIFTDGTVKEVAALLDLPDVSLAKDDQDIVHLVLLSKSKYLILTPNSTFSLWAGFLSDSPIIINREGATVSRIRKEATLFEGSSLDYSNSLKNRTPLIV